MPHGIARPWQQKRAVVLDLTHGGQPAVQRHGICKHPKYPLQFFKSPPDFSPTPWRINAFFFARLCARRKNFTVSIDSLRQGRVYTALTAAFSHQDFMHFAANMIGGRSQCTASRACGLACLCCCMQRGLVAAGPTWSVGALTAIAISPWHGSAWHGLHMCTLLYSRCFAGGRSGCILDGAEGRAQAWKRLQKDPKQKPCAGCRPAGIC